MTQVLVIDAAPELYADALESRFGRASFAYARTAEEVIARLQADQPEVVFSIKGPDFPGPLHRPAYTHDSVRWLHVGGSGFEHLLPLDNPSVTVTNCAGVLANHLAETVTGAMLALNGNVLRYVQQQRERKWRAMPFRPLSGQTLLIVGLGAIGRRVAHNAKALGMRVIAIRRRRSEEPHVDALHSPEALMEVLPEADFVSLHVRLNDETHHMIGLEALAAMKPGSYLMNTSRGGVVDTAALVGALQSGYLAGAYLDVFEEEPLPTSSALWSLDNVLLTPHAADNISGWPVEFARYFGDNLERWQEGEPLGNVVAAS